jgi:hypothetical protein
VKATVNGPEATALGASSAFKNEAAAGLRRASVSGRRWREAVANKRRQVQVRGQSRSAGSSAGSSVAAQRQLSGQLWADDGTPRPNSARQQLGCRRRAAGGRRGPPHSTPTKPSPLDPQPTQPQPAAASRRSRTLHTADTRLPCITPSQRPSACMPISDSAHTLAYFHSTTWPESHWLRPSAPSPVTVPGGAALAHHGTPGYCNPL